MESEKGPVAMPLCMQVMAVSRAALVGKSQGEVEVDLGVLLWRLKGVVGEGGK